MKNFLNRFEEMQFEHILNHPAFFGAVTLILLLSLLAIFFKIINKKNKSSSMAPRPEEKTKIQKLASQEKTDLQKDTGKDADYDSWLAKLHKGLSKTRNSLQDNIMKIFSGNKVLDDNTLEHLHEIFFRADIGVSTADKLIDHLKNSGIDKHDWDSLKSVLHTKILNIFKNAQTNTPPSQNEDTPRVILVVGVNGAGKTTSIGKLAAHFIAQEKTVLLCAADTYRAAAIDQLKVWGERLGARVIAHKQGSDPAAVAYDGVKSAISKKADILLVDTAGRLHNKNDLMEELSKIKKVIGKDLPNAPHEIWLVIDATTGQNAFQQVQAFNQIVNLSGLVVTKLDGTAKGGVIIGISDKFKLPIKYIGVGEKANDLHEFVAEEYLNSLFGDPQTVS